MLLLVPPKKPLRKDTTALYAPETVRELRPILQGAELTLRIRIVVRDVRTAVRLGDAQLASTDLMSCTTSPPSAVLRKLNIF